MNDDVESHVLGVLGMTRTQFGAYVHARAIDAGLDDDTADACAHRVLERVSAPRTGQIPLWVRLIIQDEIQKHAAP